MLKSPKMVSPGHFTRVAASLNVFCGFVCSLVYKWTSKEHGTLLRDSWFHINWVAIIKACQGTYLSFGKKIKRQSNPLSKLLERQMNRVLPELERKCSVGNGCDHRIEENPHRAPSGTCIVGAVIHMGRSHWCSACLLQGAGEHLWVWLP